jgi:hypothetical protein
VAKKDQDSGNRDQNCRVLQHGSHEASGQCCDHAEDRVGEGQPQQVTKAVDHQAAFPVRGFRGCPSSKIRNGDGDHRVNARGEIKCDPADEDPQKGPDHGPTVQKARRLCLLNRPGQSRRSAFSR